MPSAVIAKYEYDPDRQILKIIFQSGLIYEYFDVPVEVYASMRKEQSKGYFLNKHIKGNYRFRKLNADGTLF